MSAGFLKIWYFIKLTRPLFLAGGLLLYLLGAWIAVFEGAPLNLLRLITGQALVTAIQMMTHYSNEYFDQEGDRINTDRTWFSGGSGVLASGVFSPRTARSAAILLGGLSILALFAASLQVPPILLPGMLSLLAAWSYSGPPLTLVRTGWGELSASLVVAFFVPLVGYMMQSGGKFSIRLLVICLPLILIHFAMLIAFQIPDHLADQATGKRTLSVRFGKKCAARLHNLLIFLAFLWMLGLAIAHRPGSQYVWLALPLAVWQLSSIRHIVRQAAPHYQKLTLGALALFAVTAGLWLAGFTWMLINA